ncbi:MAG: hypothetical protein HY394_01170 [Candidatus Diapherotrites archaeon]|nr:hypothetical protein [Candidatus Diapherotrites archaeon]
MPLFEDFVGIYEFFFMALIYISIGLHFLAAKGWFNKLKLVIAVIGFFFLVGTIPFFYAFVFILAWLVLMGIPLMVDRTTALILLVVAAIIGPRNPFFLFLSLGLYAIINFWFIYSAFETLEKKPAGRQ